MKKFVYVKRTEKVYRWRLYDPDTREEYEEVSSKRPVKGVFISKEPAGTKTTTYKATFEAFEQIAEKEETFKDE